MRFRKLVTTYGIHSDLSLDFAPGAKLHVLVGPNEAGKSTLRTAMGDYLYGVHNQTPYAFLHKTSDLRISGVLDTDGGGFSATRLKRLKNTVVDDQGAPLTRDPIAAAVGSMDRGLFERMYSMDRHQLAEGGRQMLSNKDDTSKMLFQAASGLSDFTKLIEELETEADTLFGRRAGNRAYWVASDRHDKAKLRSRETTIRKADYRKRLDTFESARANLEAGRSEASEVATDLQAKRRLRSTAPHLRAWREATAEREALGEVTRLAPDARQVYASAVMVEDEAGADVRRLQDKVEQVRASAAGVEVDELVLEHQQLIKAAAEHVQRTARHRVDLGTQEERAQGALRLALDCGQRLSWGRLDGAGALLARQPDNLVVAEVQDKAMRHAALAARAEQASKGLLAAQDKLATRQREAAAATAMEVPAVLKQAVESAGALGDTVGAGSKARDAVIMAEASRQSQMDLLAPWSGDIDQLRALTPPAAEEAARVALALAKLADRLEGAQKRKDQALAAIRHNLAEVMTLSSGDSAASSVDVQRTRGERDALWPAVAAAQRTDDDLRAYLKSQAAADSAADQRFKHSEIAHQQDALESRGKEFQQQLEDAGNECSTLRQEQEDLTQEWERALDAAGLPRIAPGAYAKWLKDYERALELVAAEAAARRIDHEHQQQVLTQTDSLRTALTAAGQPVAELKDATLPALLALGRELIQAAVRGQGALAAAKNAEKEAEATVEAARRDADAAEQALARWTEGWSKALDAAGLPVSASVAAAQAALTEFPMLRQHLQTHSEASGRVTGMRRDLEQMEEAVRRASAAVEPAAGTGLSAEDQLSALSARLAAAEIARSRRAELKKELSQREEELAAAKDRLARAQARLKPLLADAECADRACLDKAIERSDEARRLELLAQEARGKALVAADGAPLDDLEAALADTDLDRLTATIRELEQRAGELDARRESATVQLRDAERELELVGGGSEAAAAEADRQMALAEMSAAVERYAEIVATVALLRHGLNRYREAHKDPLLQTASRIFADLTEGRYVKLEVDDEQEKTPRLLGHHVTGRTVDVTGMSDGTRDQLYLALRLAALEAHLEGGGVAAPFIADDLFVNFDDGRAAAGFRVLGALTQKIQVIYLSHHQHLEGIARQAVGDQLDLIVIARH